MVVWSLRLYLLGKHDLIIRHRICCLIKYGKTLHSPQEIDPCHEIIPPRR